ncbi:hypothetical protein GRI38_04300 [Altererythrobacter aurantiacus]|uniref:TNase-like domain-containing protein n=1 Tax=Parapontixanthobacter aurantiacus TaxID=1463599 RepID=A0A844ZCH6_9SPHN|nr:thermonuclease family protein [Parapontixanthobacter aurantiacus]MXO85244.1 hypothetical protein [Parapontixanthobacter aurantiacus]
MGSGQVSLPPLPPGFTLVESAEEMPKKKAKRIPPPPPGFTLVDPEATDGDTVKAGEIRVRLLGVDAPELRQQGWDRDGQPIPIGEQSRAALADRLGNGPVVMGDTAHMSYGRPVAPLTMDDRDAGLAMLESGNAVVVPQYLQDQPQRLADYAAADRGARLNRRGPLHSTVNQSPEEFRADPDYVPERETIAKFWDTPTPNSGLSAEAEQEYLALLKTGTADEIIAFLARNGHATREDELRDWVAKRDADPSSVNASVLYESGVRIPIDSGDGAGGAAVRGFAEGFLAGGLDEAGAIVDTLGGTAGRESVWNSDRRLADIWLNNQQQNAAILDYDQGNHPYAATGGEIAGALTSGVVIPYGQAARTVPQLAKVGAVYGGAEGFLGTDGSTADRLTGAAIGVPAGAIVGAVGGKAIEYGAPIVARGYRAVTGRNGDRGTKAAGEAVEGYGEEQALDAALDMPQGRDIPPPPPGYRIDAMPMEMEAAPSVSAIPEGTTRRLLDPATDAERLAAAQNVQPNDVLPLPGNAVDGVEEAAAIDAGRFAQAKPLDERKALERTTIRSYDGKEVPKVGPLDMVGWLRTQGGLRDEGGELSFMDLNNAPRRGLDHVGQEARFGPLVNDEGMSLDDAALQAWEAGYFPELSDRPDINTFLDALSDTYNGGAGRRFRPEDAPEVEAFDALRTERLQLEQEITERGPIYEDRGIASDDAPFPPVEAYEEWPSDAIERVGNIDVSKLETPQDIRRALKTSYNAVGGFDAATRGRVTQAETERLASELNMTPEQLLSRRKGQAFNAEEALAARQILAKSANELVNAAKRLKARGDDPGAEELARFRHIWTRHVAIQESVAGMTAEAGRALQQFRQAADSRQFRGDVLNALVRAGGGGDRLQDTADIIIDAAELSPGKFNALVKKAANPKFKDKVAELYINMLLSNPPTHIVNMVSNSLTAIAQVPEYATASVIGAARKAVLGKAAKEQILGSEVGARAFGLIQGAKEGAKLFARGLRTGEADDFVSKVEGDEYKAISGKKGEVIRLPTRFLTAEDQFFKGIARRMELNAQALRIAHREGLKGEEREARIAELLADPTDEMFERALEYGRYLTFQTKLGPFGQKISGMTTDSLFAKVIIPFVRTPINLLKFAVERSPAAPALAEWRKEFVAGGSRRDLAIAKAMLGSGFAAVIYEAALDGRVTGSTPPNSGKARLLYADGWEPYSIKVGNRWISYSRMDPFSTTIGMAADLATLPDNLSERQRDDKLMMVTASFMSNLASKVWLSGVSSFVEGLSDPGRYADNWLNRTVGAFTVPAGVAGVARAIDPVSRKRESIGEAIRSRIPGLSSDLLPRRDVFGRQIEFDSLGPDILSPFWQSEAKNDPVVAEMLRIGKNVSAPGKQYTENGERKDYTPEEYDRYHELAGRLTHEGLAELIASDEYAAMNIAQQNKAAKKAIREAREAAREELFGNGDGAEAAGGSDGAIPPPPPGFAIEGESGGRNVFADLKDAIPGIRFTSGYRDQAYQDDMRRRGYKPAWNSEHLDGSSLDMLPPPGKSMEWLKAQVRRYDPKAKLLIHDGHLHASFPGYYGAPTFEGARDAGLKNPLEGMPPPPPGFTLEVQ